VKHSLERCLASSVAKAMYGGQVRGRLLVGAIPLDNALSRVALYRRIENGNITDAVVARKTGPRSDSSQNQTT
jgi:hypothetical protein